MELNYKLLCTNVMGPGKYIQAFFCKRAIFMSFYTNFLFFGIHGTSCCFCFPQGTKCPFYQISDDVSKNFKNLTVFEFLIIF